MIKTKDLKSQWDFSKLYSGITDPKLEKDIKATEAAYDFFAKKYKKAIDAEKNYMNDGAKLLEALADWKNLMDKTGVCKPLWYLHLLRDIDTQNAKITALFNAYEVLITKSANQIIFFNLNLAKISADNQKKFMADPALAEYRMYLNSIFEIAQYNLSESEEKILNLKHAPSHEMWVSAQSALLTKQMVKHEVKEGGKKKAKMIPITEAQAIKPDLPIKQRRALHTEIVNKFKEISFFAEAEMNAVVANKRVTDDLRGFAKPYEATVLGYQNSIKSVEALVAAVNNRMKDANRFWKLKAKVLGLPKLTLAELGTKLSMDKQKNKAATKYPLAAGAQMISDAFRAVKPSFGDMFDGFLSEGKFDAYPRKGKKGGAYCSGGHGVPTHIMMNYSDDMNGVSTMAHEMGHAIHTELSKKQGALYSDYTISIAEVASTFFENVLFDYLLERVTPQERQAMILEKIQDDIFTTHSQIAYFNYEVALHAAIKEKGALSAAEMAKLFMDCRKPFLGSAFELTEADGYGFIAVPHFRYFFYVYAYAYGQLIANALYAEYKKDSAFIEKIEYFLSAGGSKKPDDIFKDIGIDVTKADFFEKGLEEILNKIKAAEKMVAKSAKK